MKNKKKTYFVLVILLAIVALSIGYAAVSRLLDVTGTATVLESDGVQLEFTGTPTTSGGQTGTTASINGSDATKATCTVVLKNMGESATCSYTVTNNTSDTTISAKDLAVGVFQDSGFATAWSASSSDYFTITSNIGANTLANGASTTVTVTVTLKKENTTGSSITENFYVKVEGDTQQS